MGYVFAQTKGGWKKYEGNPVLGGPEMGTCFDVFLEHVNDEFLMHFSWRPKGSLAVVRSTDGIHWGEPEILLGPNPDSGWEDRLNRNCVLYKDGVWHMWYTGQARGYSWIGYAASTDGHHYTRMSEQPVLYSERPYEGFSVMNPFVMWDDVQKLFRMWYAAGETYEPNVLAYATSPDGLHWNKLPANPIFIGDKRFLHEKDRVGACHLVYHEGWYYMFYIGYEDIDTARICVARSQNGVTGWQRSVNNPIVSPSPDDWDANACYKPFAYCDEANDRWMLWYNGRREGAEYVGLVIHEGLDLGEFKE